MPHLYIGIDPGVTTGYAEWDSLQKKLLQVTSYKAVEAERRVLDLFEIHGDGIMVVIEDTRGLRLPKRLQSNESRAQTKGVGSVHRDMGRWEEFCGHYGIPYKMRPLGKNPLRKSDGDAFRRYTGYDARTSEHGRDAAAQVFGM